MTLWLVKQCRNMKCGVADVIICCLYLNVMDTEERRERWR